MELEKTSPAKEFIGGIAERLGATAKAATIFAKTPASFTNWNDVMPSRSTGSLARVLTTHAKTFA